MSTAVRQPQRPRPDPPAAAPGGAVGAAGDAVGLRDLELAAPAMSPARRRLLLRVLAPAALVGTGVATAAGAAGGAGGGGASVAVSVVAAAACAALAAAAARRLGRLARLETEGKVLAAALANRLAGVAALTAVSGSAGPAFGAVLAAVLDGAATVLRASHGSILLRAATAGDLRVAAAHGGGAAALDGSVAERVARSWEPMLVGADPARPGRGHSGSALYVPLLHRGRLLGVLHLGSAGSAGEERFTTRDLRALGSFAVDAAGLVADARSRELERRATAGRVDVDTRKSAFLAAVSHDLRTPLTTLLGCTRMLPRPGLSEAHRAELATMIGRQAERLSTMVEDLLAAARIEAETPPPPVPVDVAALVREVAARHDAASTIAFDGPPSAIALGQDGDVRRAVAHLLDNACRHGRPPVSVTVSESPVGVDVAVRDHGSGIPAADRDRVFERFTRLDAARSTPGTGLGLSIVRGLAASAGGEAWVDAPADGGPGTVAVVRLRPA